MLRSAPHASPGAGPDRSDRAAWEELRQLIWTAGVKKDGPYKLSAGGTSPYLFDLKPVMLHPRGGQLIGQLGAAAVRSMAPDARFVGGREVGAIPIATLVVAAPGEPRLHGFFVRKQAKEHGTKLLVEGNLPRGPTVIVEDVSTTGASILATIEEARKAEADVRGVVTVVDREEGAAQRFAGMGLPFQPIYRKADFPELASLLR